QHRLAPIAPQSANNAFDGLRKRACRRDYDSIYLPRTKPAPPFGKKIGKLNKPPAKELANHIHRG
ncbi:MAG TPA: hypothetical protein VGP42_04240, partial [Stellaceae bacterium]|nr:hypothetical protein [Stellaceae bacterium]